MTAAELRALAQRVVETWRATVASTTPRQYHARERVSDEAQDALGRALGLSTLDDEGARVILAALDDAERVATERALAWQPMDTAPRDGTWVLVWDDYLERCTVAHLVPGEGHWHDVDGHAVHPRAWMPLPDPPR